MNSRAFEFLSDVVERSKILDYFGSSKHSSAQASVEGHDRVFFPAEITCPDPCTGLKKMSFWCSDDPCKIGQGDPPFKCECEVNVGAVVGIVIGCVAAVCVVGSIGFFCYLMARRRQAASIGVVGNTTEHAMQQHAAFGGAAPMPASPGYVVAAPYGSPGMMGMPQQAVTTTTTTNYTYNPNAVMVPGAGGYGYGGGMASPPMQNPAFMQQPVMGAPLATTGYGYAADSPIQRF